MRHATTQALVQRFTGSVEDIVGLAQALRVLGATAQQARTLCVLLGVGGEVLAIASAEGRIQTWTRCVVDEVDPIELDFADDGWFATEQMVFFVHKGRPFALKRGGRLAVGEASELPKDAERLPDAAITPFLLAAADCVESFVGEE